MKIFIHNKYLCLMALILTGGLVAMTSYHGDKCLYKICFIPFHIETYMPVSKDSIGTAAHYQIGFYREHEFCNNLKQLFESQPTDLKIDNRVIRLKFKSSKNDLIYYVDQNGIVEKNNKETFKLDENTLQEITKKVLYFSGVVDCKVVTLREDN